jgi:ABC-2 type transport system permease protein
VNKTFLVFRHEFFNTVKRRAFIIMTFIVPLLALLGIGAYHVISGSIQPSVEITYIGYIDNVGGFNQAKTQGKIELQPYETVDKANQGLVNKDITGYIVISQDYLNTGTMNYYTLEKQLVPPTDIVAAIKNFLSSNLLAGKVPQSTVALIEAPLNMTSVRLTETGAVSPEQGGLSNLLVPGIFSLLLYLSIVFSSSYLIQGLGDEKENRLIEVLLSSVSTRELLVGKVLGLGAVGLVQVAVWVISTPLIVGLASSSIGGFFTNLQVGPTFLVLCLVYFILGYLFFATISMAVGAISPSAREAQQLVTIFTLPAVAPLWFASAILFFPNNPVWVALTIFPVTAPVTLMLRLGATAVPAWQIAASVIVLAAITVGGMLLTVKIVRTYLLMYGKRPSLGEIIRNFRAG